MAASSFVAPSTEPVVDTAAQQSLKFSDTLIASATNDLFIQELHKGFSTIEQALNDFECSANVVGLYDYLCKSRLQAHGLCDGCLTRFDRSHVMQKALFDCAFAIHNAQNPDNEADKKLCDFFEAHGRVFRKLIQSTLCRKNYDL
eukprot:9268216-Karenia_brevis.AAC.1